MKRFVAISLCCLIGLSTLSGCYGKMALTRKVYQVNGEVKDKYLRSLVTWVFIFVPVYGISALADFIVFNTIEFWSGNNPVASGEKNLHYAHAGEDYSIKAVKEGDEIRYTIDRYRSGAYVDTLTINWDTVSGNSQALFKESGRTTEYLARAEAGGVRVTSHAAGALSQAGEQVALYR